jgi:hypothetical protein
MRMLSAIFFFLLIYQSKEYRYYKMSKLYIFLVNFLASILFNQSSLAQSLSNFDFQKAYAIGELANLPDSIIIVAEVSEFGEKERYTTMNKIKNNIYGLNFWFDRGGLVDPATYKCNLKLKLEDNFVYFKFCKKKVKYLVKEIEADKEKLLLKKITTLPEVY